MPKKQETTWGKYHISVICRFEDLNIFIIDLKILLYVSLFFDWWPGNKQHQCESIWGRVGLSRFLAFSLRFEALSDRAWDRLLTDRQKNKKNSGCLTDLTQRCWGLGDQQRVWTGNLLPQVMEGCFCTWREVVVNLFVKGDSKEICQGHVCLMVGTHCKGVAFYTH